jgi:hypothetical protein
MLGPTAYSQCVSWGSGHASFGIGNLPQGQDQTSVDLLPPRASTWLTATVKVLERCPGAFPVQFTAFYDSNGQRTAVSLPGFPDLSQVPYTDCAGQVSAGG